MTYPKPLGQTTRSTCLHLHDRLETILKGEYCGEPVQLSLYEHSVLAEAKSVLGDLVGESITASQNAILSKTPQANLHIPAREPVIVRDEIPSPKEATND